MITTTTDAEALVKDSIDAYIRSLNYDPRRLLSVQPDGATESLGSTSRTKGSNEVIITTKKQHSLRKNLTDVVILRPTSGVIYPGALVLADEALMEGLPVPISLPRAPLTLSAELPGLLKSGRTIDNPTNSSVQDAIASIVEEWNQEPKTQGYINAARSFTEVKTIYSSQQVALDLGFSAKWASGSAAAQLTGSDNSETTSVLAHYKQVFYTVAIDLPPRPAAVFGPTVTADDLRHVSDANHPPAYVRSVDYGRILMIKMETSSRETKADLQAALKQVTSGGVEVDASLKAKYASIVRNATFTVIAIGGGAETAASFTGSEEDLKGLAAYIKKDATFRRDNPGAPVSYTVAFLKNNSVATMGFTTDYTETESLRYPNGYVKLQHSGGYVARFTVTWEEPDANGNYVAKSWSSGQKTAGYSQQIDLPGDARTVKIVGEAATGLVWDPWGEAINVTLNGPSNKCYRIKGTTLNRSWDES